ncbi:MAG: SpoIID/LytB domain-containing protein, partial [Candidatus Omnitrophica bacterium]|nr:SpoIID/LytB domain-containing protein [Candidatus Omnitrophota bacterium]
MKYPPKIFVFGSLRTFQTLAVTGLVLILIALFLRGFSEQKGPEVRVLLSGDKTELSVLSPEGCDVYDMETSEHIKKNLKILRPLRVAASARGIVFGETLIRSREIRIVPRGGGAIRLDGKEYRGTMQIYLERGTLSAVNHVRLEYYLKGVLPREVNQYWPFETLKAQAIASRSFAVY